MLRKWDELPHFMKCDEVKVYYDILAKRTTALCIKRAVDFVLAGILFVILFIPMAVIGVLIKLDSKGPVFYRQERITAYGKKFRIHKFRTMVENADQIGTAVTVEADRRITKIGAKLRGMRLDEIPQLIDVLEGNMSFVGTRPEATRYVKQYSREMLATLLLPAGITSEASIRYKDEAGLLESAEDADWVYIEKVLPKKMKINLRNIREFSLWNEWKTMARTVGAMLGKDYK